jgi:phosphate transport system substrate-binding protein
MKSWLLAGLFACLTITAAAAQDLAAYPAYVPDTTVTGTLTIWGNDGMANLERLWEASFHRFQPQVSFDVHLVSTAAGIGGLYAGHADLAYMGRDIWQVEDLGFTKTFGYHPTRFVATTGAYDVEGKTFPMVVFINKDNPLRGLKLAQLDALFGTERKLGAPKAIHTWGELGLTGEWADKPIHLYAYSNDSGFGIFFSAATMGGSSKWNCDINQFDNLVDANGKTTTPAGKRILEALAPDKYGLAYSTIRYITSEEKTVPIAVDAKSPFVAPTRANVLDRSYPLARDIPIYINLAPGKALDPKLREFLLFILSREGQEAVIKEGEYLPLPASLVTQQRQRLK